MSGLLADLRQLWRTRKDSGFPWPFQGYSLWEAFWGRPDYNLITRRMRLEGLFMAPFRPYRYLRMVRLIAKVRRAPYAHGDYDSVA